MCWSTSVEPRLAPVTRPVNTTVSPALMALRFGEMVIEPIVIGTRDGFMLGVPAITGGLTGMLLRVGEGVGGFALVTA
jgi:hypothetical protein